MAKAKFSPIQMAYSKFEPTDVDTSLAPILFLHGLTTSKEFWVNIPQIIATATKRTSFAIDARNHGDTEWSDEWNFDLNADDLIHFMESHGIQRAVLVGHSMGGITSIKVALKRPELVEKIVVEDMFVQKLPNMIITFILMYFSMCQNAVENAPADVDEDDVTRHLIQFIKNKLPARMQQNAGDLEKYERIIPVRRGANGRYVLKANYHVITRELKKSDTLMTEAEGVFEGPALFIYGGKSLFAVDAHKDHIKKFFPNTVFQEIEGATHAVHSDKPAEFNEAVIKFISATGPKM